MNRNKMGIVAIFANTIPNHLVVRGMVKRMVVVNAP